MRRREFLRVLGSAAVMWPLAVRAQPGDRMRRIGILLTATEDDAQFQTLVGAFLQALALSGWTIGRNVRIDTRWATTNVAEIRRHAAELVALSPDVILAHATGAVGPLLQVTRTVPIVFPIAVDPVGAGLVDSLARPGGNATGFLSYEYSVSGKWLELLKQIAPGMTRVAVLRNPAISSGPAQFGVIQAVAPSLRVEVSPLNMRDAPEIERAVTAFARSSNGGLIVTASGLTQLHRDLIVTLAARHKLPAVYPERFFVAAGGLLLWARFRRPVPPRRRLRRPHPQGREARRPAGAGTNQVRNGDQPENRQGARRRRAAVAARQRHRGNRIEMLFCLLRWIWQRLALGDQSGMSAVWSLSGVKPTSARPAEIDANDPTATFAGLSCCSSEPV